MNPKVLTKIARRNPGQAWWRTPLIPPLGRQRQVDLSEVVAILLYVVSSPDIQGYTDRPCLKKQNKIKNPPPPKLINGQTNKATFYHRGLLLIF